MSAYVDIFCVDVDLNHGVRVALDRIVEIGGGPVLSRATRSENEWNKDVDTLKAALEAPRRKGLREIGKLRDLPISENAP